MAWIYLQFKGTIRYHKVGFISHYLQTYPLYPTPSIILSYHHIPLVTILSHYILLHLITSHYFHYINHHIPLLCHDISVKYELVKQPPHPQVQPFAACVRKKRLLKAAGRTIWSDCRRLENIPLNLLGKNHSFEWI